MAAETGIEWADATWNPTVGCTKVSAGCDHRYAETLVNRFAGSNSGFPNRFDTMTLRGEKTLTLPLRWRTPKRIFVNSLSDLFHDDVPDEFIARVFAVMALAPRHTFQLLTKRHARMRSLLSSDEFTDPDDGPIARAASELSWSPCVDFGRCEWPLSNVWLGVSVENQQWADIRIPALLDTPAAVRWISAEPLLGALDLRQWLSSQQSDGFGRTVTLDDQVRHERFEEDDDVRRTADGPRTHRFPPVPLDALVVPANDAASDSALEPVDDLGGGAENGHANTASGLGDPAPIEVALTIEHPGDVAQHAVVTGHGDALRRADAALTSGNAARLVDSPPNGGASASDAVGDLLDGLAGDIGGKGLGRRDRVSLHDTNPPTLDWVVAGGESGPGARPMHPDWARSLRDQCVAAGVPFLFKQHGEWAPGSSPRGERQDAVVARDTGEWLTPPHRLWDEKPHTDTENRRGWAFVHRAGKKAAGRELDGRTWDKFPQAVTHA